LKFSRSVPLEKYKMRNQFIKCELQDLSVLRDLAIETFANTYRHLNTPENFKLYVDTAFDESQIQKEMNNPDSTFYFLQSNTNSIGYIKINEGDAQNEEMPADHLELERIYLAKAQQGNGYGKLMIDFVKEIANAKGKSVIWLGVWQKNANAIGFYESQGFVKAGTHEFVLGDDVQTDWVMEMRMD